MERLSPKQPLLTELMPQPPDRLGGPPPPCIDVASWGVTREAGLAVAGAVPCRSTWWV